jgi:hypothetical protein
MNASKQFSIFALFVLTTIYSYSIDSLSLKKKYVQRNSDNLGSFYFGWNTIATGEGKTELFSVGFGKLLVYEKYIKNNLSLSIGLAELNSRQKYNDFNMFLLYVPVSIKYSPKFLGNIVGFKVSTLNGYQKYEFANDSFNFKNFQSNLTTEIVLNWYPKKLFGHKNTNFVFEFNESFRIYNFTKPYPEFVLSSIGFRYIFIKK